MSVTPYQRDVIRHPTTGRIIASVTKVGEELHLDLPTVLRPDEARIIGHALARWGTPATWGEPDMPPDRGTNPNDPDNGGGGGAAAAAA